MEEEKYMRRCIELAKNGLCNAAPNPMVGAVIVCDGRIIGEGYHIRCGEAHAEVNAIRSVKDESLLKRSTIYVSLEPCSHYGKTPPCADLIIEKQIPRIVIGCQDPFSQVAGRGIQKLKDAGLWICGTDINTEKYYYNQDLTGPIGIVIGNEGSGMSEKVRKNCDFLVKIPMKGKVTSLNASVSTGIVIYEALKQRLNKMKGE